MKFLRKWLSLRYRLRARRWRARAVVAEAEVKMLRLLLTAERNRNMLREDTFASAAVLGQRGMWGMAPRSGPAVAPEKPKAQAPDPYNLSGADLMEFDLEWKPIAEAQGIPMHEAKRRFIAEVVVPRRMPLNDDPFNHAN